MQGTYGQDIVRTGCQDIPGKQGQETGLCREPSGRGGSRRRSQRTLDGTGTSPSKHRSGFLKPVLKVIRIMKRLSLVRQTLVVRQNVLLGLPAISGSNFLVLLVV